MLLEDQSMHSGFKYTQLILIWWTFLVYSAKWMMHLKFLSPDYKLGAGSRTLSTSNVLEKNGEEKK